mgnify:CR=1 FL=1
MTYEAELAFCRNLLKTFHLNSILIDPETADFSEFDQGIRKLLGMNDIYTKARNFLLYKIKPNTIYRVRDGLFCSYAFFLLPGKDSPNILMIGPYTLSEATKQSLMQVTEKYTIPAQLFSLIENYFYSVPYLSNENILIATLNTLGEKMWGGLDYFTAEVLDLFHAPTILPFSISPELVKQQESQINIQSIEKRYQFENDLLLAVSQGLSHKVEHLFGNMNMKYFEQRCADPLRNFQNYCIIFNSLLRKAAENGSVHPFYIDKLSSDFARKIESITTQDGGAKLLREMLHKYCLLVRNHSMKNYSLLIQKVITHVDSDLTGDLSLNAIASELNINASYLSGLFKKETGTTLTDYVNRKRMEHAILLLNSTTLQIQTIAQYCGIPDVNYFTKLFKKYYQKTPKEYRQNLLQGKAD